MINKHVLYKDKDITQINRLFRIFSIKNTVGICNKFVKGGMAAINPMIKKLAPNNKAYDIRNVPVVKTIIILEMNPSLIT